ncbi:MAG: hypothetical protein ACJAU4_000488 [Glaciecola sp.]|jgi:hypothetical protein
MYINKTIEYYAPNTIKTQSIMSNTEDKVAMLAAKNG